MPNAVPPPIKNLFEGYYRNVLVTRHPWQHIYEYSSPFAWRNFHMAAYPDPEERIVVRGNPADIGFPWSFLSVCQRALS